jgi:hypothetical protein
MFVVVVVVVVVVQFKQSSIEESMIRAARNLQIGIFVYASLQVSLEVTNSIPNLILTQK